jgi:hypothetical protein
MDSARAGIAFFTSNQTVIGQPTIHQPFHACEGGCLSSIAIFDRQALASVEPHRLRDQPANPILGSGVESGWGCCGKDRALNCHKIGRRAGSEGRRIPAFNHDDIIAVRVIRRAVAKID